MVASCGLRSSRHRHRGRGWFPTEGSAYTVWKASRGGSLGALLAAFISQRLVLLGDDLILSTVDP